MTEDITVRVLRPEEWQRYKDVRLTALRESPEAFVADYDVEVGYDDEMWRNRMPRSARLLAESGGQAVGVASVGDSEGDDGKVIAKLFGLWVAPALRGAGVAAALVRAGARTAATQGHTQLGYWVGSGNGRAVAFAVSFGFRPTDLRRPLRMPDGHSEEEVLLVMPLSSDGGELTTT
ncbi:MAG: GNAT family N-acetyltransferase [Micrococcales bacterium]|nr:MAG: GNAT family N-acetyltransferase [Micrococcales bacterium]